MTELKTLKDFYKGPYEFGKEFIDVAILRVEAIKWVKEWQNDMDCYEDGLECQEDLHQGLHGAIMGFLDFFNLTEDDLK